MIQSRASHRVVLGDEEDELVPVDAAEDQAVPVLGHHVELVEPEHVIQAAEELRS